jgi:competence protein ComEC
LTALPALLPDPRRVPGPPAALPRRAAWLHFVLVRALAGRCAAALGAARGRLALWLPVAMGAGIAAYFALPFEPPPAWRWAGLLAPLPTLLLAPRHPVAAWLAALPAMAALGAGLASWHTARQPPMPDLPRGAVIVTGMVRQVDILPEGRRVTLEAPRLGAEAPLQRHLRIRLRTEDPARPRPGDMLTVRALVRPPSGPAYPGAWDFQRAAWFSGLGGSGFAIGPASVEAQPGETPFFAGLRGAMEARVGAVLAGPEAAIATALLVGGQSAIPQPDLVAMRDSGLAHILSVSGMHIAIVMGLTFSALRLLLAAVPPLALRLPVKILAALAALAAGGFYMLLTGAQVPMQRSFAMALLATVALVAGRRALTLRAWALALAVVLVIEPVSLLGPSAQMSFAAVLALIAGWEALRPRITAWPARRRWWGRILLMLGGVVLTSILAGAATAPYALHHFGRVQWYGVVANAMAVPLTSFLVMPAAMLAALLMPLGMEAPALVVVAWGIRAMLAVAHWVAAWPGAAMSLAPTPPWSVAIVSAGMLWLCLLRGRWRWAGAPLLAGGMLAGVLLPRPPDLLVSADARLIAARAGEEVLMQRSSGASSLTRESWVRLWADPPLAAWPREGEAAEGRVRCTPGACTLRLAHDAPPVVVLRGDPPRAACAEAALVVSAEPVRGRCAAPVIDRFSVWRNGAHAAWITPGGVVVAHDRGLRGDRPWVPPVPQPRASPPRETPSATE